MKQQIARIRLNGRNTMCAISRTNNGLNATTKIYDNITKSSLNRLVNSVKFETVGNKRIGYNGYWKRY